MLDGGQSRRLALAHCRCQIVARPRGCVVTGQGEQVADNLVHRGRIRVTERQSGAEVRERIRVCVQRARVITS